MNSRLYRLLEQLTAEEQAEAQTFAMFLLARRRLEKAQALSNEIPIGELMQLVTDSGGFDWLEATGEDVYSIEDGKAVRWQSPS